MQYIQCTCTLTANCQMRSDMEFYGSRSALKKFWIVKHFRFIDRDAQSANISSSFYCHSMKHSIPHTVMRNLQNTTSWEWRITTDPLQHWEVTGILLDYQRSFPGQQGAQASPIRQGGSAY
jgi:hypothetical protein